MVVHTFNPRIWKRKAYKFICQPDVYSNFQDSQDYTKRACLKKNQINKQMYTIL